MDNRKMPVVDNAVQCRIISELQVRTGRTCSELAQTMALDDGTVLDALMDLREKGYVVLGRDPGGDRIAWIFSADPDPRLAPGHRQKTQTAHRWSSGQGTRTHSFGHAPTARRYHLPPLAAGHLREEITMALNPKQLAAADKVMAAALRWRRADQELARKVETETGSMVAGAAQGGERVTVDRSVERLGNTEQMDRFRVATEDLRHAVDHYASALK